jgi:hypothetical protein
MAAAPSTPPDTGFDDRQLTLPLDLPRYASENTAPLPAPTEPPIPIRQ